jgi:hypothetical protein
VPLSIRMVPIATFSAALLAAPVPGHATLSSVIDSTNVPLDEVAGTGALCPAGTTTVGGGVAPDFAGVVTQSSPVIADGTPDGGRLFDRPDGSGPGPLGWQAGVRSFGIGPGTVKVAAICSDGDSTRTTVASAIAETSHWGNALAVCPSGRNAIGGGVDLDQVSSLSVTSIGPLMEYPELEIEGPAPFFFKPDGIHPAPVGWFSVARNDGDQARLVKVAAVCSASFPAQTVIDSITVPAGGQASLRVPCPGGLHASSGGAALENVLNMFLVGSGPYFRLRSGAEPDLDAMEDGPASGPAGWAATAYNIGFGPLTMKVAAICVPEPGAAAQQLVAAAVLVLFGRRRAGR